MPHLPEWIVDTMENLLSSKFFDAEVVSASFLNQEIVKVTFKADLQSMPFYPGWPVMLRVGANDLRHYTFSSFDKQNGLFDIVFHVHGNAPGSDLVSKMKSGDHLKMAVPAGRKMYSPEHKNHFFFGDETSLSFMMILINDIIKNNGIYSGILELRPQNITISKLLQLNVDTVIHTPDNPAGEAIDKLKQLINKADFSFDSSVFYLTGNVSSVQAFRKELKRIGINPKNIKLQGYWAEGSVGL